MFNIAESQSWTGEDRYALRADSGKQPISEPRRYCRWRSVHSGYSTARSGTSMVDTSTLTIRNDI
jgi:hypothetical protein